MAFFDAMGVSRQQPEPKGVGSKMRDLVVTDLTARLQIEHLSIQAERKLHEFEQYSYLKAIGELAKDPAGQGVLQAIGAIETFIARSESTVESELSELIGRLSDVYGDSLMQRRLLLDTLGEESVLGLDITVDRPSPYPSSTASHLVAGFSLKWSLRTDRGQDPRTQGAKMAALRRGRMPHFAVITMEPRPYFLALLGRGSGDIDCVYHMNLPALTAAVEDVCGSSTGQRRRRTYDLFRQLCEMGRLRDYDDLLAYVATL